MNFLTPEETPIQKIESEPYHIFTENDIINDVVNEANGESNKVTDDMFADSEIPLGEFAEELEAQTPEERRMSITTSVFVVETADQVISKGVAAWAHCDDETLLASQAQIKKVAIYFSPYFGTGKLKLPPWVMGLIAAAILLFDKIKVASEIRKANLALEAEKEKTASLESEISKLQKEIQVSKLTKQAETLRAEVIPAT
jgi:hypothetical protein